MDRNAPDPNDEFATSMGGESIDRPPQGTAFKQASRTTGEENETELGL